MTGSLKGQSRRDNVWLGVGLDKGAEETVKSTEGIRRLHPAKSGRIERDRPGDEAFMVDDILDIVRK
jgi:hypothetical protein